MSKQFGRYALIFIILLVLQVLVLNNIKLSGYINPYIYILFIMLLPFETPRWALLVLGFSTGLTIDAFMGTLGMHSTATLFIAFMRPFILSNISIKDTADRKGNPILSMKDIGWFVKYTMLIVFMHHFVLFYIESFTFTHFFSTLFRVVLSSLVTSFFIIIGQAFFIRN
ncbi:MAG TPA: rod shape-determining protein MreD [Bacteroidales bacterium]|nr:rod shape-determining protein MreD [Bacteroidales bacterium]